MVQDKVRGRLALPAVAVGVLAVSAAAIFIRLADAPAVAVAFWRCALGAALLLPPAVVRRERFPRGKSLYIGLASESGPAYGPVRSTSAARIGGASAIDSSRSDIGIPAIASSMDPPV